MAKCTDTRVLYSMDGFVGASCAQDNGEPVVVAYNISYSNTHAKDSSLMLRRDLPGELSASQYIPHKLSHLVYICYVYGWLLH